MSAGRTMTAEELRDLVASLRARPHLWRGRIEPDPDQRQYVRVLASEHVEVWLIAWTNGQDTGFHDHDDSAAAIAVLEGTVVDERLALGTTPPAQRHGSGAVLTVEPASIHRMRHVGEQPALTLHAYSPPLARMGSYEIGAGGALLRHARRGDERLEPAATA